MIDNLLLICKFYLICLPLVKKDITLINLTSSFFNYRVLTKCLALSYNKSQLWLYFHWSLSEVHLRSEDCLRDQGDKI